MDLLYAAAPMDGHVFFPPEDRCLRPGRLSSRIDNRKTDKLMQRNEHGGWFLDEGSETASAKYGGLAQLRSAPLKNPAEAKL